MMSGMAGSVIIWEPRPGEEEWGEVRERESSSLDTDIEGVTVQHWPDFTAKKKQVKKKKAATKSS